MSSLLFRSRLKPLIVSLGLAMLMLLTMMLTLSPTVWAAPNAPAAIITVTNIADNGAGSLRDALIAANNGDTIQFSVPANSTIVLTSGELTVTKAIAIDGSTAVNLAVSGNHASRVFSVTAPLAIVSLTIRDGSTSDNGAGLYTRKALTLTNVTFLMNTANNGGGLYVHNTQSVLALTNVAFLTNTANTAGGGLYVYGTVSQTILSSTTFISNTAAGAGGGALIGSPATLNECLFTSNSGGNGGGLYISYAGILTNVTFISNTAAGSGGGAYILGAAKFSGGMFEHNNALGPIYYYNGGGGLYIENTLDLTGTQFLSNTATSRGGGLAIAAGSPATFTNAIFIGNIATTSRGGGAYLSGQSIVNGGSFVLNSAPDTTNGSGGGLYVNDTLSLTDTQFFTNIAGVQGGGLYAPHATLNNATFIGNVATTSTGGGAYILAGDKVNGGSFERNWARDGGGLGTAGQLTLSNTQFLSNTADYNGGGLYASFSPVGLTNVSFVGNTATGGQGGGAAIAGSVTASDSTFKGNSAFTLGGGAAIGGPVRINGGTFEGNSALNTTIGFGGGLYVTSTLTLTGTQFVGNSAGARGGGVYVSSNGTTILTVTTFISNIAVAQEGGGLYAVDTLYLTGTQFLSNTAGSNGGGMSAHVGRAFVTNTAFISNIANTWGGGMYLSTVPNGMLSLTGSQFNTNIASVSGGGLYANGAATVNSTQWRGNTCMMVTCTSNGLYANNHLTLTQVVTTTDDWAMLRDFINNGAFVQFGGAVTFQGTVAQSISGTMPTTFSDLVMANPAVGVTLRQNITVTNHLTLANDLTTRNYTLTMTANAISTGDGDVWGLTYRHHTFSLDTQYPFGSPHVAVNFSSGTPPTALSVYLSPTMASGVSGTLVTRFYSITANGGDTFTAALRLHYRDAELNGNTEDQLDLWRFAGTWQIYTATARDAANNWVENDTVTGFSPWVIAATSNSPTAVQLKALNVMSNGVDWPLILLFGLLFGVAMDLWVKFRRVYWSK